ncbi:MAG TPA: phosphate ABC transporter permease subunit PstC [Chthoniobacterales bacterium]|nr:phosphate ABC transporter permease subunit PstC [Chthoniobacterales bacterium]
MESVASSRSLLPARRKSRRLQAALEKGIKAFFGGNAILAVIVLALITIFLFREGFGFFGQNLANLRVYRQAGLEYVDIIRAVGEQHEALSRRLSDIRLGEAQHLEKRGTPVDETAAILAPFDKFAAEFGDTAENLRGLISESTDQATSLKEELAASRTMDPARLDVALPTLRQAEPAFDSVATDMTARIAALLATAPPISDPASSRIFGHWKSTVGNYLKEFPGAAARLRSWSPNEPIPWHRSIQSFLFGREWVTASFWQDWYGIIPLLTGSVLVSFVALLIAVPLGVSSAIYVSEVASRGERKLIKPIIEFVSAIPSVVLGFFGIAVVGEAIRAASQSSLLSWVSFFPISERLNVMTAGCLLAFMAIPTIFTLAEDALRNVPRGFKEASYALGANRLQTIGRVIVPASLSGIISAILLGLGRVIGETMVVLLCAGNRIAIPDFTQGVGSFFQPVHTMTGIIAQEMGEVVRGSIHYRALFMVGLVLFTITLAINWLAQRFVARFRMSIG